MTLLTALPQRAEPVHSDPITLRSLRLSCAPVSEQDAPFYRHLFGMPAMNAHRPSAVPRSDLETAKMLRHDMEHWKAYGFGRMRLMHAGNVVGLGGLSRKAGFDGLNLSYHLVPDWWGFGLASEFVRASLDYASELLRAESVYGLVRPSNTASIRVLEKVGFEAVGIHAMGGAPMRELRRHLRRAD